MTKKLSVTTKTVLYCTVLYCTVLCCTGPGAPYDRLGCVCPPVQDTFNWHKCDQLKIKYILNSLGSWLDNYDHWCLVLQCHQKSSDKTEEQ